MLEKTGIELHWPGYQYMGPGMHLKKRLARGDPVINHLDKVAKQHDVDKHTADRKMIKSIDNFKGKKILTEKVVKNIMKTKLGLKM